MKHPHGSLHLATISLVADAVEGTAENTVGEVPDVDDHLPALMRVHRRRPLLCPVAAGASKPEGTDLRVGGGLLAREIAGSVGMMERSLARRLVTLNGEWASAS